MEVNKSQIEQEEKEYRLEVTARYQHDEVKSWWGKRLVTNYNKAVVSVVCLQYFNAALRLLVMRGVQSLVNRHMGPESYAPLREKLMWPWFFKVFFGIFMDSFPLFGSTKKSYIIVTAIVQVVVLLLMAFGPSFTLS